MQTVIECEIPNVNADLWIVILQWNKCRFVIISCKIVTRPTQTSSNVDAADCEWLEKKAAASGAAASRDRCVCTIPQMGTNTNTTGKTNTSTIRITKKENKWHWTNYPAIPGNLCAILEKIESHNLLPLWCLCCVFQLQCAKPKRYGAPGWVANKCWCHTKHKNWICYISGFRDTPIRVRMSERRR